VFWSDLIAETFIIARRGSGPEARRKIEALLPSGHRARFVEQAAGVRQELRACFGQLHA
jgi:hypothetical protein